MSKDTKSKPSKISGRRERDPNATRSLAMDQRSVMQDYVSGPQSNQKGASTSSRLDSDLPFEITLEMEAGAKSAPQLVVIQDTESKSDVAMDTAVNDLNSTMVKDQSPQQVYQRLTSVLLEYSAEIDITLNEKAQCIDCVLFTPNSFEALRFKLAVFEHNGCTRFELLRDDGGVLSMAKFEGDLKALFFGGNKSNKQSETENENEDEAKEKEHDPFTFISMDPLDVSGIPSLPSMSGMTVPGKMSSEELDDIYESLKEDDRHCVEDLHDLFSELVKDQSMAQDITDHGKLVNTVIDAAMKNQDIAVVRGCILILDQLCSDKDVAMLLMQEHFIYKQLSEVLKGSKSVLIRNYVIRLLATLSALKWNMDSDLAKEVKSMVHQYHEEWKQSLSVQNGLITEQTFTAINDKLSQFN